MKTDTNFEISIPKPCHEDWNKFTPDERGAFCQVCNKSVFDFTKKTDEEIKDILIQELNAGNKVCGRVNEDQITPVVPSRNLSYAALPALNPVDLNFRRLKKFAAALFLVFGGLLFTSSKSSAQRLKGKMMVNRNKPIAETTISNLNAPKEGLPEVAKCEKTKGEMAIMRVEPVEITDKIIETLLRKKEVRIL